jgi:hypothetical protein
MRGFPYMIFYMILEIKIIVAAGFHRVLLEVIHAAKGNGAVAAHVIPEAPKTISLELSVTGNGFPLFEAVFKIA